MRSATVDLSRSCENSHNRPAPHLLYCCDMPDSVACRSEGNTNQACHTWCWVFAFLPACLPVCLPACQSVCLCYLTTYEIPNVRSHLFIYFDITLILILNTSYVKSYLWLDVTKTRWLWCPPVCMPVCVCVGCVCVCGECQCSCSTV